MTAPLTAAVDISAADLERIFRVYDQGLYLQAYHLSQAIAPLQNWRGAPARVLAGRMAGNLGGVRLASWHFLRAYREDRRHAEACWFHARYLLDFRGPWRALRFMRQQGEFANATIDSRSHWFSLYATVFGRLRDFDAAEQWLARAEAVGARHPWTHLERAALLSAEDRHDEAIQAARTSLEIRPWYRPAVQWLAHFLVQKEKDDEALNLLREASQRLESCAVLSQLAALQMELHHYADARKTLDEVERLSPLMEEEMSEWLASRRADAAYFDGDLDKALAYARTVKGRFFENMVKRLEERSQESSRVTVGSPLSQWRQVLPVGYVQQHYQTCAPATLAAISRFWSMPGDHLEMAASITYAGTPNHSERRWAQEHGWFTKEFTVTWESAVALIDQGIPFTLTTPEVTSSHLQAVIGYDRLRQTLVIRDPSERHQIEFLAVGLQERYASTGPRGLALVPEAEKARLAPLELPDAELYDHFHRLCLTLDAHDRTEAEQEYRVMQRQAENHQLTWQAMRTLASYDDDPSDILAATEKMLQLFPDDVRLQLSKVSCLRELARRDEYVAVLKKLSDQEKIDSACWQQYAVALSDDAREHPRALRLFGRALRFNPFDARTYFWLARIYWDRRDFSESLDLYRFAACLEDKDEHLARTYFLAAIAVGRKDEALQLLQKRFERFGAKSGHPARTLAGAYFQLERGPEGFALLDRALTMRPDDGELLLFAVEKRILHGEFARAEEMLARAQGHVPPTGWLRCAAQLKVYQGDLVGAREQWAEVLKVEPLAGDAHRAYTQLLAETESRTAALRHLEQTCARFPYNFALNHLWLDWLRDDGPQAVEPVVRKLLEIHPVDAWSRRELALALGDQGKLDEAFVELEEAARLEPLTATLYTVRGHLQTLAGRTEEAKASYREALRLMVDFELALQEWIALCDGQLERREALAFVEQEFVRQVISGAGLLAFRDAAQFTLEPDELLAALQRALDARPDLWQSWAAVVRQHRQMDHIDQALDLAREAVDRFPLLPALWVELAEVHLAHKDDDAAIRALQRALQINPDWNVPLRLLTDIEERRGRAEAARTLLERSVARSPLAAPNHFTLAELLWRLGRKDEALERVQHTLQLEPGFEAAWENLCRWSSEMNCFQVAIDYARDLTKRRAGETRSWMRLAQALMRLPPTQRGDQKQRAECLAALRRGIELNPRSLDAYDHLAQALTEDRRFDEARAACNAPVWKGTPPLILRGRRAWVEAQAGNINEAINQMRAALDEDPSYYWGWTQLAEWYVNTGQHQNYLSAAQHMVRLNPQSPVPWGYRGEAKLFLGDRDGAKEDLQKAIDVGPDYAFAGMLLFDEQLAAGEMKEAKQTLKTLQQHVGGDYVTARRVQWHVRRDQKTLARKFLRQLCQSQDPSTWPLETAARAMSAAGWQDAATQIFRQAVREKQWHPFIAVLLAESMQAAPAVPGAAKGDLHAGIALLDQALPRLDDKLRPLDLKAELLAKAQRFDEALQVCQLAPPDAAIPLRGRAAWIEYQRGNKPAAVAGMQEAVATDPQYYWGWSQLAEWHEELGPPDKHLEAAQHMTELAADNPVAFVHRAEANRKLNNKKAAREDYQRALDLAPDFVYPGLQLFDLLLEENNTRAAKKVLRGLRMYCLPIEYAARAIRLRLALNEKEAACKVFDKLCRRRDGDEKSLEEAARVLCQAGLTNEVEQSLLNRLDAGFHISNLWVKLAAEQGQLQMRQQQIEQLPANHAGKLNAVMSFAVALGRAKKLPALYAWAKRHDALLRSLPLSWGMVGHAFSMALDDRGVIDWMHDWQQRGDAQSWMLINLALAMRGLGRYAEAQEISRHSLAQAAPDYTTPFHETWLLFDNALAGNTKAVRQYFDEHDAAQLDANHQWIAALSRALLYTLQRPETEAAFDDARRHLAQTAKAIRDPIDRDAAFAVAYRKCVRQIAGNCGGLQPMLWSVWRTWQPLLPKLKKGNED